MRNYTTSVLLLKIINLISWILIWLNINSYLFIKWYNGWNRLDGRGILMSHKQFGFVGTYTRETSEGVYRFTLDQTEGKLHNAKVAAKIGSPTYVTFDEQGNYLYSVAQNSDQGGIAAFEINKETGELRYLNRKLDDGAPPCHLSVSGDELVAGNYHKGTVDLFLTNERGSVQSNLGAAKHEGSGPHERQEKPHVHYTAYTPDGKYIIAADLGTDELVTYQKNNNRLKRVATYEATAGSGPRHIEFHPNGETAYLLTELSSEVIVLAYDSDEGIFTEKQIIKAIPSDFNETNDASAIYASSDGRFLYTGNRGHNSITVFEINEQTDELTLVEHVSTEGEWPRDFALDPTEEFIVVAHQHTGNLVLFKRDEQTGRLSFTGSELTVPEGVCVKFLQ